MVETVSKFTVYGMSHAPGTVGRFGRTLPGGASAAVPSGHRRPGGGRERGAHLAARADVELREDAVQVGCDRAVREVEALADLAVGQPVSGELGDLQLLRGEAVASIGVSSAAGFAGFRLRHARAVLAADDAAAATASPRRSARAAAASAASASPRMPAIVAATVSAPASHIGSTHSIARRRP